MGGSNGSQPYCEGITLRFVSKQVSPPAFLTTRGIIRNIMKDKGYLWWKEIWISICSTHFTPDEECIRCQKGKYYNNWKIKLIAFWWKITNRKY